MKKKTFVEINNPKFCIIFYPKTKNDLDFVLKVLNQSLNRKIISEGFYSEARNE